MKKLNIALLGLGTVGSGVVKNHRREPTANSRYIK